MVSILEIRPILTLKRLTYGPKMLTRKSSNVAIDIPHKKSSSRQLSSRFLCNKRCSKVIFRVLDNEATHKHVLRRKMTEICNLTL